MTASTAVGNAESLRRRFAWPTPGLVAAAALLALAACAPRQKPPVETAPPPPPPPLVEEKPVERRPEQAHRVAILVPLSGTNAPVGISLANAATLAVADSRKDGVRLTSYDTAALGSAAAARKALEEGAELILGPLLASEVPAVRAAAEPRGVTVLSFSNDLSVAGGNAYVLGFQPAQSVERAVKWAAGRGARRFAALVPDGVYGQRASVAFTRAVNEAGGQVVALASFARTPKALPAAARTVTDHDARARAAGGALKRPDGTIAPVQTQMPPVAFETLLIADSGSVASAFLPHLARHGVAPGSVQILGTELWATEPGLASVGGLAGAAFASVPDARFRALANRYRARFGGQPSRLASLSYDAMLLAISAADGNWPIGQPFPARLLADPKGFVGVDGIFRFRNNVAERGLEVQQVGPAGFTTVSQSPSAF